MSWHGKRVCSHKSVCTFTQPWDSWQNPDKILALENPSSCPLILNGLEINNIQDYNACEQNIPDSGVCISLWSKIPLFKYVFLFPTPCVWISLFVFFVIKCQDLELCLPVCTGGALCVNKKSLQGFLCFFCKDKAQNLLISLVINDPPFTQQIN